MENTPDDPRQRKPDISKAKEVLGWEPKVKLREGLPLMEEDFRLRLNVPKNWKTCLWVYEFVSFWNYMVFVIYYSAFDFIYFYWSLLCCRKISWEVILQWGTPRFCLNILWYAHHIIMFFFFWVFDPWNIMFLYPL